MVNYQNGIIYRIYDNTNGDVYYGSTANILRVRMGEHKNDAKRDKKCKSKSIILNGDYFYSEIEKYPCNSKKELETRERYYIENFTCVNKSIPTRTRQEYREDHKEEQQEYMKKYREDHKEEVKEYYQNNKEERNEYSKKYNQDHKEEKQKYRKKYNQDHKEEKQEYNRKYREDHKEEVNERSKKHYYDNTERLNETHICNCGGKYSTQNKARHINTKKHQKYITDNAPICIECK